MKEIVSVLLLAAAGVAQTRPAFEVASVKLNTHCAESHDSEKISPGRISVTCITLRNLMQAAYGTFANGPDPSWMTLRIVGAPEWVASDRYDIAAKAESAVPMQQMLGSMLQVLLEDRFQLKVHRESREMPVYALTVAKGGLKLRPAKEGNCIPVGLDHANDPSPNFCGMKAHINGAHVTDEALGMSMTEIANRFVSNRLDRPVIDKTGIHGRFDAHLEFDRPDDPAGDPTGPSIFTAVQEQLGLKLTPDKGPVEVLVIDRVEKPGEN